LAKIVTDKPIAVSFVSDQHIDVGGPTDLSQMMADAELIQQTPGMYCVLGGDGVNNHIKHRSAMANSKSAPGEEWRVYNHYLSVLGLKILGIISGNHDAWSYDFAGIDMVFELAKKQKVHYAPDEMVLTVELVDDSESEGQPYVIKIRHKYRYSSSLNLLHTVKRLFDQGSDPFDVGVVCHQHEGAMETFKRHGLTRYAFRPGSYQVSSDFTSAMGFNLTSPTCPTVVLWPEYRKIVPFEDVRDAAGFLGWLRSG